MHGHTGVGAVLPVFVINREADSQRLAAMRKQLDSLGIAWERLPAINGATLSPEILLHENRRARPRKLSPGEIGCLRSHARAWQWIAEGQAEAGLVLEDDVLLASDVTVLIRDLGWLPSDDCIVRLETFSMPVILAERVSTVSGRGIHPLRSIHYGSAAYIITRQRARALLHALGKRIDNADSFLFRYPVRNHVYQLSPALCIQYRRHFRARSGDSLLEDERSHMLRQSHRDPVAMAHRLIWKAGSLLGIGIDMARGYSLFTVPYHE